MATSEADFLQQECMSLYNINDSNIAYKVTCSKLNDLMVMRITYLDDMNTLRNKSFNATRLPLKLKVVYILVIFLKTTYSSMQVHL